ncbi:hypothetical protein Tco_0598088 [Tanacetum coccineum]
MQAACDRQKSYANKKRKPMEFQVGDKVMLKVSPWKWDRTFWQTGEVNPKYVGPFKVLKQVRSVAYKLELPQELSRVHNTFHVFNLKKYHADESLAVSLDGLHIDDKLYNAPGHIIPLRPIFGGVTWNNAMRTNHQNFSNSRRNFSQTAVLIKSGIVPISTARHSSSKAAAPISTVRPINTAAPKPFVNIAQTRPNAFQKSHLLFRRPFYQQTTLNNRNLYNKVNTVKLNYVNTAKGKRVTSAVGEQRINVVQSLAYRIWRPKRHVIDHIFKNSGSYISLAIPGQTTTGKELSNPLMADSLPKTILPTKLMG